MENRHKSENSIFIQPSLGYDFQLQSKSGSSNSKHFSKKTNTTIKRQQFIKQIPHLNNSLL